MKIENNQIKYPLKFPYTTFSIYFCILDTEIGKQEVVMFSYGLLWYKIDLSLPLINQGP